MPSDALNYTVLILLLILAGSFLLIINGQEVPTFIKEIALTFAIALAIIIFQEKQGKVRCGDQRSTQLQDQSE